MDFRNNQLVDSFLQFFRDYYEDEVLELANKYPSEQRSLHIDYDDLYQFDHDLAMDVKSEPKQTLEYAEEALKLYDLPVDIQLVDARIRVFNLPETVDIRDLRVQDDHVGSMIAVEGIARKTTDVRPKVVEAVFDCERCGTENPDPTGDDDTFAEPEECIGCERQGPFRLNHTKSTFVDAQTIRVQESPEDLAGGETPQSIDVSIQDDIVGEVTPGNHITVVGSLHITRESSRDSESTFFDLYMDGSSITVDDEEFDNMDVDQSDIDTIKEISEKPDLFDRMVGSIAPSIYGYEEEKLAMILQLFSGVTKHLPDGSRIRGDFHVLMVGDPGTGKSMLLSYVDNIAPRSVYTSGKGASSAGLTASAVRDNFGEDGQWSLEAGALVLADKGIAAVDELDKMADSDRSALHESLEQQKVSISKAGINATLKSRCSLLAAANPKYGRFDDYEPIPQQINLEPALISRFDLIFTVTDEPNFEEDTELAEHVIQTNYAGEINTQRANVTESSVTQEQIDEAIETANPEIEPEMLRKYIAYAKRECFPTMTPEAKSVIKDFYVGLRTDGLDEDDPIPITARKLEALVRLAEASARVRLSEEVEEEDAQRAVDIVQSCLEDIGVDPETGEFDADVIATGKSKSSRETEKLIVGIVEDLEGGGDDDAHIDDIASNAEDAGLDVDIDQKIRELQDDGRIYSPQKDYYRAI